MTIRAFFAGTMLALFAAACGSGDNDKKGGQRPGGDPVGSASESPPVTVASCTETFVEGSACDGKSTPGRTYYVSASGGADSNDGLAEDRPLKTLAAVNALAVGPGDRVLFKCGDTWTGEELVITKSGSECNHLLYGSYPDLCPGGDQPTFKGSIPVTGFQNDGGSLWVADLSAGDNAGKFTKGIDQVFRASGARLPMGKWPNPEDPAFDHGYSYIDAQPDGVTLEDDELPDGDWAGAVIRGKAIRWLLLNRRVTSSSGHRITLENPLACFGDTCGPPSSGDAPHGWGYLITNHLNTLDREGEWYFDEATSKLHLVSTTEPADIEASAIAADLTTDDVVEQRGMITLGKNLGEHVNYVVVENLRVQNGWASGITLPKNLAKDDGEQNVIRCNTVWNVEMRGINLATWVWDAGDDSGWRGGHDLVVANNVVDGPNYYGIVSWAYRATFQDNVVKNVGLAENLGKNGLGCDFEGDNCTEPGDGFLAPRDKAAFTSHSLTIRGNVFENTAYCGIDLFGNAIDVENNVIRHACITKSDGGAIRTFGRDGFDQSQLTDITLKGNVVTDTVGNVDGTSSEFHVGFGFGLYIDNYSKNVVADGNTIVNSNAAGILVQNSRASVTNNLLFGNGTNFGGAVNVVVDSDVSAITNNVLYATTDRASCIFTEGGAVIEKSDDNYLFAPVNDSPMFGLDRGPVPIADWQAAGLDAASKKAWFTESGSTATRGEVFVNDTGATQSFTLDGAYVDLDQQPVTSPLELPPYSGKVLVKTN